MHILFSHTFYSHRVKFTVVPSRLYAGVHKLNENYAYGWKTIDARRAPRWIFHILHYYNSSVCRFEMHLDSIATTDTEMYFYWILLDATVLRLRNHCIWNVFSAVRPPPFLCVYSIDLMMRAISSPRRRWKRHPNRTEVDRLLFGSISHHPKCERETLSYSFDCFLVLSFPLILQANLLMSLKYICEIARQIRFSECIFEEYGNTHLRLPSNRMEPTPKKHTHINGTSCLRN